MGAPQVAPALLQGFPMIGPARAQVWSYSPEYRRPRHFHAEPELNLVLHGSARFGVGSAWIDVRAGELLSFPPGQDHVMLHASPDLVLLAVGAKQEVVCDVASKELGSHIPLYLRPPAAHFAALTACASKLAGTGNEARVLELWEAASAVRRNSTHCRPIPPHVLTRRAADIMGQDLEVDRDALAKHLRCHPTELSRHFHRDFGITLVRYRTRLRLLMFIREIDLAAGNLVAAALRAGFGSYSQCYRAFAAELACSPSEFFAGGLRGSMENRFEPLTTRRNSNVDSADEASANG